MLFLPRHPADSFNAASLGLEAVPGESILITMAEAFAVIAIVSSIAQLVDTSAKLVERINEFRKHVQGIPKVFRGISVILPVLTDGFNKTKEHLESDRINEPTRKALAPLVDKCLLQLATLDVILAKVSPTAEDSSWKRGKKAVRSFNKETEVKAIEHTLTENFHTISQLLMLHGVTNNPLPEPPVPLEPTMTMETELPPYQYTDERSCEMTQTKTEKIAMRPAVFLLPFDRDDHFVNRQGVLDQITHKFESQRRVAISGMGGVG